jgi:carboxymethylenebutenolidase
MIQLTADDGVKFGAYEAGGNGTATAGLVVIQEIFGVNAHIRSVADTYAREGFYAIAPALFDRAEPGVELDYSPESIQIGRGLIGRIEREEMLKDIAASIAHARGQTTTGKVGVIGYCLGGTFAWLSATRLGADAAVGYYGNMLPFIGETPGCPVMLHFGALDQHIPVSDVEKMKAARPEVPIYIYEGAGHGFNCDVRGSYCATAAALAFSRSLAFLKENLHA